MLVSIQQKNYWEALIAMTISFMAAVVILALTLNLTATLIVLIFAISAITFHRSFSWGWLFLLAILMLFPSVRIDDGNIFINDLLLATLSLIGLIHLASGYFRLPDNNLSASFFWLIVLGGIFILGGFMMRDRINKELLQIATIYVFIWIALITFQYYFQTPKRIKRFFFILTLVGVLHSTFGLVMLIGNWQTNSGMGIAHDKKQNLIWQETKYQINGFLGLGLEERLKSCGLAQLLMIGIPSSWGLFLIEKQKRRNENSHQMLLTRIKRKRGRKRKKTWLNTWIILKYKIRDFFYRHLKVPRYKMTLMETIWLLAFGVQFLALIFTHSYNSLVFLAIGLLVFGILDRNRRLIIFSISLIIALTIIFPGTSNNLDAGQSKTVTRWLGSYRLIANNWFLGNGWKVYGDATGVSQTSISNSYLLIWNYFGFSGLIIFLFMLFDFFRKAYDSYRRSDGINRIWLMVVVSIFISYFFEAMTNNALVYGPAAIVFWLLYGAVLNLRQKRIIFGLTETRIN